MRRYYMELIVRGEYPSDDWSSCRRFVKCNVTAPSELLARRTALEQAWANRLLVVRFTRIRPRKIS